MSTYTAQFSHEDLVDGFHQIQRGTQLYSDHRKELLRRISSGDLMTHTQEELIREIQSLNAQLVERQQRVDGLKARIEDQERGKPKSEDSEGLVQLGRLRSVSGQMTAINSAATSQASQATSDIIQGLLTIAELLHEQNEITRGMME